MRTKKESPLRAAGRRRSAKRIARVSRRIRSTESDATVGALADGVQVEDLGEVVLYQVKDRIGLEVRIQRGTVWLTQAQMAKLFGRERSVVSKHVNNLFTEGELDRNSNVQNMHIASSDKASSSNSRAHPGERGGRRAISMPISRDRAYVYL
jgi:hypothetical protein